MLLFRKVELKSLCLKFYSLVQVGSSIGMQNQLFLLPILVFEKNAHVIWNEASAAAKVPCEGVSTGLEG